MNIFISNSRILITSFLFSFMLLYQGKLLFADQPSSIIDIANLTTQVGNFERVSGSVGNGHFGVPVAGGFDVNNDGFNDYMFSAMRASPLQRNNAGQVHFILGNGTVNGSLDTSVSNPRIINIYGDVQQENTGSELWMDDVTGDGLGDLLIARQNFDAGSRPGAGALTIIVGTSQFENLIPADNVIDLRNPPAGLTVFTITGAEAGDRLGIWMRTGDVDGDGISDFVVAADQDDGVNNSEPHSGSMYLIRGGNHLNTTRTVDLANFGNTVLSGNIARIVPPTGSTEFHLGSTCQIADLDGNGRAEVLGSAALNRVGAELQPLPGGGPTHAGNGLPEGTLFIAWDNLFPATPWPAGMLHRFGTSPASETVINGAADNDAFGEELLGGLDYDNDQQADLFVGDLSGQGNGLSSSGIGYVFYNAAILKGLNFDMQAPPANLNISRFNGGFVGGIGADTAMHGDFDGDGIDDLAFSSPHGVPLGRKDAGIIHVFHGRDGQWPTTIDLRPGQLPSASEIRVTEIYGAHGTTTNDTGDVLSYSGAVGDIDKDGRDDLITNEMVGNGVGANGVDRGNLVIISGKLLEQAPIQSPTMGFEFGNILVDHHSSTITTLSVRDNPLVILGPPGNRGPDPGVAALLGVNSNGFSVAFKEWDYRLREFGDQFHAKEQLSYLIGEPGRIEFDNGTIWEMGSFELSGTKQWVAQRFQSAFPSKPSLFLTAQTMNGSQKFALKARAVTNTGFQASMIEEEFLNDGHVVETIAYLAIYSASESGRILVNGNGLPYLLKSGNVNHQFSNFPSGIVRLEEEKSRDIESFHVNETVNTLNIVNLFFAQIISDNGPDTVALRKQTP
jgi:hypothetical protein